MYTECPECQTAFRLTANVLRQAQGRVRCGDCGNVFNALDHLSEEPPAADAGNTTTVRAFERESRELLESLDQLTGGREVRIEDTGVEWRVLDEGDDEDAAETATGDALRWTFADVDEARESKRQDPEPAAARVMSNAATTLAPSTAAAPPQRALDLRDEHEPGAELRFDDNTPLPEDFYRSVDTRPPEVEPQPEPPPPVDDRQEPLDLGDDWEELLDEVEAVEPPTSADANDEAPGDAPHPAAAGPGESLPDMSFGSAALEAVPQDGAADAERSVDEEIDRELLLAAADGGMDHDEADAEADDRLVETIVMEGDTITDLMTGAESVEPPSIPGSEAEPETPAGDPADSRLARYWPAAATVLLCLALAAQLVHANRDSLARFPFFEKSVAPVYEALGDPVVPAWNIRGWRFESTTGNVDDAGLRLTITSRLKNDSGESLPYPLIHVSLTDRYDEVIGSRILEPADYLAVQGSASRPVRAGHTFTAVIAIDAPSPDATGFKLNVCYPAAGSHVRCAIEDFRN